MTAAPLSYAVPPGTHPYWQNLLQRCGLAASELAAASPPQSSTLLLPDDSDVDSPTLRRLVAEKHTAGAPILAGRRWGAQLGVATAAGGSLGLTTTPAPAARRLQPAPLLVLPLPTAGQMLRHAPTLTELRGTELRGVHEVIAAADHGVLRRSIAAGLRSLQFAAGRPYAQLVHHPAGYAQTLAVRIDADDYNAAATSQVLASLAAAGLRASWFIDVERHLRRGGMSSLATIAAAGHELQSHCFHHYTYRSPTRNLANLRRSLQELQAFGVTACAVAAPFGSWNEGYAAAVASCGLRWSSEFSRVYDEVPGAFGNNAAEPWQVPIHPVCPALLAAAGADAAAIENWFLTELQRCQQRGEPAVFYGHPIRDLDNCPQLLPRIAAAARTAGRLWQPTLGELHDFYRLRANQRPTILLGPGGLHGRNEGPAPLQIELPTGRRVLATAGFALSLPTNHGADALERQLVIPRPTTPRPLRRRPLRHGRLQLARLLREIRS